MFDNGLLPPPPVVAPPEEVIDCLVEDAPGGAAQPVRWSEYLPDGLLADLLAGPAEVDPEHREFEALERVCWLDRPRLTRSTANSKRWSASGAGSG